jgi:WD40 repeat protein
LGGGGREGTLRVWNSSGALQHEYKFPARIDALAFAPKLDTIAVAPSELPLEIRNLADGKLVASFPATFSGSIAIAYSPDGHWLASADSDTEVRIIDTAKLAVHARASDLLVEPLSVVFSSDSSRLITGTADGVVSVIDPNSGKIAKLFPRQTGVVYALCASPDGKSVTGAYYNPDQVSAPAKVMVWDSSSAALRASVPPQDSGFTGGAYLADGTLVLTSGVSKELKLWGYR